MVNLRGQSIDRAIEIRFDNWFVCDQKTRSQNARDQQVMAPKLGVAIESLRILTNDFV